MFTDADREVAAVHPFVRMHEFVPHPETVALLRSADALFLPMHDLPAGIRAGIVPQKTYEYVAAGRPIVAAVPDGDARDLLAASGVARLCRPSDVAGIKAALRGEIERWRAGEDPPAVRADVLTRCTSARLTSEVAEVYAALAAQG